METAKNVLGVYTDNGTENGKSYSMLGYILGSYSDYTRVI